MLALITRFVFDVEHLDVSDQDFLEEQVRSIRRYVEQFPDAERDRRALEWIERHAQHYRVAWQKRVISDRSSRGRCPDCPLLRRDAAAQCEIHARWKQLLHDYLGDRISSRAYVEDTLRLLTEHKAELKVVARDEH